MESSLHSILCEIPLLSNMWFTSNYSLQFLQRGGPMVFTGFYNPLKFIYKHSTEVLYTKNIVWKVRKHLYESLLFIFLGNFLNFYNSMTEELFWFPLHYFLVGRTKDRYILKSTVLVLRSNEQRYKLKPEVLHYLNYLWVQTLIEIKFIYSFFVSFNFTSFWRKNS